MSKGRIAVLLLTILVLNLGAGVSCGAASQGPTDQRPAESQSLAQQDVKEKNEQPTKKQKDQER
jgi:uncharacterized protein HemX